MQNIYVSTLPQIEGYNKSIFLDYNKLRIMIVMLVTEYKIDRFASITKRKERKTKQIKTRLL